MKKKFRKFRIIFDIEIDFESQTLALLVIWFLIFCNRYEIDLKVIFYQWPKLGLGLDVEAEIQILKVIYCICQQ